LEDDEEWKENACEVMLVRHDGVLQGISCYEHRGILECAEEIPPWEKDWIYAMFTAANPQSQLPRKDRPNNTIGGVGAACHVAYAKLSNDLNVPIYRHQTTQRSLDLAIRQGNTLVYA